MTSLTHPTVTRSPLHWTWLLAFALGATACSPTRSNDASARAHQLVEQGATLLDVRTDAEFAAGHLEGATLIPVQQLAERLQELPRDRPVVVYCQSGGRSRAAAAQLRQAGFEVHDLGAMANY